MSYLGGSNKNAGKTTPARRRVIDDDDFINDDDIDDEDLLPPPPVKKTFASPGPSAASSPSVKKSFVNLGSPVPGPSDAKASKPSTSSQDTVSSDIEKDNSFREFRKLCADIANENSHTGKTALVAKYIDKGSTGSQSRFLSCFAVFLK